MAERGAIMRLVADVVRRRFEYEPGDGERLCALAMAAKGEHDALESELREARAKAEAWDAITKRADAYEKSIRQDERVMQAVNEERARLAKERPDAE